jgi:hypothetical protein
MLIEGGEYVLRRLPIASRYHQLLLVVRSDRTHKERLDYVQLRRPPGSVNPSQRSARTRAHAAGLRITAHWAE